MPVTFVIKNLNTNNNQQVRITIEGGQSSGSFNSNINFLFAIIYYCFGGLLKKGDF